MKLNVRRGLFPTFAVLTCAAGLMSAQTLQEYSAEARLQLDLHVPPAALATFLPAGWTSNIAAQGPAN